MSHLRYHTSEMLQVVGDIMLEETSVREAIFWYPSFVHPMFKHFAYRFLFSHEQTILSIKVEM